MSIFRAKIRASKIEPADDLQEDLDRMRLTVFNQMNTLRSMHAELQYIFQGVAFGHDALLNTIGNINDKNYHKIIFFKVKTLSHGVSDFPLGVAEVKTQGSYNVSCSYRLD